MEGRLLLNVVVTEGAAVLELLAGEDQSLLVGGNALLVLDLGLDIVDRVRGLHLEGDGLARQGLHEAVARRRILVSRCCSDFCCLLLYIATMFFFFWLFFSRLLSSYISVEYSPIADV